MNLESIVRPFQQGDVFTARVAAPAQPAIVAIPDVSVLTVSGSPDTNVVEQSGPAGLSVRIKWEEDKSRRVTDTVRITNKDDASQFVDVKRIKSTVFRNSATGEELPLSLDWSGEGGA